MSGGDSSPLFHSKIIIFKYTVMIRDQFIHRFFGREGVNGATGYVTLVNMEHAVLGVGVVAYYEIGFDFEIISSNSEDFVFLYDLRWDVCPTGKWREIKAQSLDHLLDIMADLINLAETIITTGEGCEFVTPDLEPRDGLYAKNPDSVSRDRYGVTLRII